MSSFFTPQILYTMFALAACLGFGFFSYHRHTREHNSVKPRLIPWIIIAIACLATSFMLIVHLVNLFGFETGHR
jgi:amino acid transporter